MPIINSFVVMYWQGLTFPVSDFYLEDVLEKTCYEIQESDSFQGNSRQRRREQYSKKDPLTELFEACLNSLNYKSFNLYLLLSLTDIHQW